MGYLSCRADSAVSVVSSPAGTTPKEEDANNGSRSGQQRRRIQHFTYREMELATSNFSEDTLLGRGSHGSVYKARLQSSSRVVAVKRPSRIRNRHTPVKLVLTNSSSSSSSSSAAISGGTRSRNEVENEIEVLSKIYGARLVNLIGFTTEDDKRSVGGGFQGSFRKERLLVIEYMPNGSLYDLLHSEQRTPPGWARRIRLALQTAKAILSLHHHRPPVIHRDVKSANVLLDGRCNARLGDFGLAVLCDDDDVSILNVTMSPFLKSTPPAGTLGYLDPGYVTPENLSSKTDVFSFGILLLEIMSGRKAIDVQYSPPSIVEWAMPLMKRGKILPLYDPRIPPPRDLVARRQLASLAASCVRSSRDRRPSMDEVVDRLKLLRKTIPSKTWNGLTVGNPCSASAIEVQIPATSYTNTTTANKPSPISISSSTPNGSTDLAGVATPSCTGGCGRRVFAHGGRNLMDILKGSDEDTIRAISSITRLDALSMAEKGHED